MLGKLLNRIQWLRGQIPRNQAQLETELRVILKAVFWVALLALVVIIPMYYLVLALLR
jgi:hypothetical protein